MRPVPLAVASASAVAMLAALAASANQPAAPVRPTTACPVAPPRAAAGHPAMRSCPVRHGGHRRWAAHAEGDGRFHGVSASQAFEYGRQFERERGVALNGPPMHAAAPMHAANAPAPTHAAPSHAAPMQAAAGITARPWRGGGWEDHYSGGWGGRYGVSSHGYVYEQGGVPYAWAAEDEAPYYWRYGQGGGYEVYAYVGRDAYGYLVWPGKPRTPALPPALPHGAAPPLSQSGPPGQEPMNHPAQEPMNHPSQEPGPMPEPMEGPPSEGY